jgi:hypothetical protein
MNIEPRRDLLGIKLNHEGHEEPRRKKIIKK